MHVPSSLERRGLVGACAAALGLSGLGSVATEGRKRKRKKKRNKGGCDGCFRSLGSGEETIFTVGGGAEEEGISSCPAGSRAVSGTFFVGNVNCAVIEFAAVDNAFDGWKLTVRCPAGEDSDVNAVVAICIS
jgi:hypothetical protein